MLFHTPTNVTGCLTVSENESWEAFHEAKYQILVFPRTRPPQLVQEVNAICEADTLPDLRTSGSLKELETQLKQRLEGYPALFEDVWTLATRFAALSACEELKILLGFVRNDMCRRFHTDVNTQRLLCTYSGEGTLWAPHAALNEEALERGTNEEMLLAPEAVQQAAEGEVLILKGALHPHSDLGAVYHKSPPLKTEGEKRLLLRVDTPSFLAFE